jgi:predicted amidohydrolase
MADDLGELTSLAESIPGNATRRIEVVAGRWRTYTVFGLLERDGGEIYNSAVLVGPDGVIARYRKAHLPGLGLDRFVTPGNTPFSVYETPVGRIGIGICYDVRFPEAIRILALKGADIIALPSNWPCIEGVAPPSAIPNLLTRARACENRVYVAVADRVGTERGSTFLGRSQIVDVSGNILAEAGQHEEELLLADVELSLARQKDFVYIPGRFETHWFSDRRVDLYGPLVEKDLWPLTRIPVRARE